MDDELRRTIRIVDDTRRIIQLLNLYGLAIDTQRYELFDQVFTPDLQADYNPPVAFDSREAIKQTMRDFHITLDGSLHRITNHQVTVDGDRASAISYVVVRLLKAPDYFQMAGFYDDGLVRTTDGWRIARRLFRGSWWEGSTGLFGGLTPYVATLRQAADAGQVAYLGGLEKAERGAE
jgi:hypothetical protein